MKYKIEDLFDLQMGRTPERNNPEYWNNGVYKWIAIGDMPKNQKYIENTTELISDLAVKETKIPIIPANTVIMSFKLSIGKTAITTAPIYSNEAIMAFKDKHTVELMTDYIYYLLSGQKWNNAVNNAAKGKTLNKAILSQYEVNIHSIEEQRKIIAELDMITAAINECEHQIKLYNELVKSKFAKMFGNLNDNLYCFPICSLEDNILFLTSGSRGWAKYCSNCGQEWFITIKNVKNCRISLENMQKINAPDNMEAKRTKVKEGDLLISITADLGRTGVVTKEIAEHGAYINQHLTCIRLNESILHPLYVAYFMETESGKEQFEAKNQTGVKAGLNFNSIKSLQILVPPLDLQNQFADFVKQTDKSKVEIQKRIDLYTELLNEKMNEYFG